MSHVDTLKVKVITSVQGAPGDVLIYVLLLRCAGHVAT